MVTTTVLEGSKNLPNCECQELHLLFLMKECEENELIIILKHNKELFPVSKITSKVYVFSLYHQLRMVTSDM